MLFFCALSIDRVSSNAGKKSRDMLERVREKEKSEKCSLWRALWCHYIFITYVQCNIMRECL